MTSNDIFAQIKAKGSFLCVGLDTDLKKIPQHLLKYEDAMFRFNKAIIDATVPYAMAYKPNSAFYESCGLKGIIALHETVAYLKSEYPEVLVIDDAKRGDIGNTSAMYAKSIFEELGADATTVAPYMGYDSISPFLEYKDKWTIVLALTSNKGAQDFQLLQGTFKNYLYEDVLQTAKNWASKEQMMFVIGGTQAKELENVRMIIPDHFLLIPGIGAQGGSLQDSFKYGANSMCGLIVNSSRGIIYASNGEDFAEAAAREAQKMQLEMSSLLLSRGIV